VGAVVNHLRVKRFYLVCFSYIVIKGTRGKAQAIRDQMINKGNEKTMCPTTGNRTIFGGIDLGWQKFHNMFGGHKKSLNITLYLAVIRGSAKIGHQFQRPSSRR
jgi:hypothetical protein